MKPPASVVARVREMMQSPAARGNASREYNKQSVPLDEFVALLYEEGGSAYRLAKRIGVPHRVVCNRRQHVEETLGIELPRGRPEVWREQSHRRHVDIELVDGTILVGSDAHVWPEIYGVAMAAFVDFAHRLKPDHVIMNGDGLDGAQISRHSRIGWDQRPSMKEEIDALSDYLDKITKASPKSRRKRTKGNHDGRFDTYFSANAALSEGVSGTTLADHLPGWDEVMSITVNGNCIIQHRYKSGIHAVYNNVRDYGCHVVTGHRHKGEVRPWTNQMGTWWGVDAGMLAPVGHPCFDYTEQRRPTDWRSSFAVLTFRGGNLMPPEIAFVTDEDAGELYFRGQTLKYEL